MSANEQEIAARIAALDTTPSEQPQDPIDGGITEPEETGTPPVVPVDTESETVEPVEAGS